MKKLLSTISLLLIAMTVLFVASCRRLPGPDPSDIDTPTADATASAGELDISAIDGFIGDWYGICTITSAGGGFADNANVRNDCALRVALDSFGHGVCYFVINGFEGDILAGSRNIFSQCSVQIAENKLDIRGVVGGRAIEWSLKCDGAIMKLNEKYGDETDYMDMEIIVSRPDKLALSGLRPDAADYIGKNGYLGIVDKLGGSSAEMPELLPPEGVQAHNFFMSGSENNISTPTENPDAVHTGDGHFTLSLPENYVVIQNDASGFTVACSDENVWNVEFAYTDGGTDSLSLLLASNEEKKMITHYIIDSYDCYGAFLEGDTQGTALFRLCGSNGKGGLIMVNITFGLDLHAAYSYVNINNESFAQLVLGAKIH